MSRPTRPRRSRYTVTLIGGQKYVILAYSAEQVRDHYTRQGFDVRSVAKGDFRKTERTNEVVSSGGGWTIDEEAVKQAAELLGVKRPVKVRTHARVGGTHGNYRLRNRRPEQPYHDIMVKSYLSPSQASETLWHELTHASQADRCDTPEAWEAFSRNQRRYPYRVRPIEVEARETSKTFADVPLTRTAR